MRLYFSLQVGYLNVLKKRTIVVNRDIIYLNSLQMGHPDRIFTFSLSLTAEPEKQ